MALTPVARAAGIDAVVFLGLTCMHALALLVFKLNARDGEYREGHSHCLHFTNLHTQPWAPFPERFVYQAHPQGDRWFDLERSANEASFEIFTRERPSSLYRALGSDPPLDRVPIDDLPWVLDAKLESGGPVHLEIACDPPGGVQRGPDGDRE